MFGSNPTNEGPENEATQAAKAKHIGVNVGVSCRRSGDVAAALSRPLIWVTASTNLSWSSAVHRSRGFGSKVRTKQARRRGEATQAAIRSDINISAAIVGSQMLSLQNKPQPNLASTSGGHRENWGESMMAEASPRTDTSTDDTDNKNQRHERGQLAAVAASDSIDKSKEKSGDQKEYVQQLESSHLKLTKQGLKRPRACQQV
nr:transcription factor hbp-1b(c1) [Quercus suber]